MKVPIVLLNGEISEMDWDERSENLVRSKLPEPGSFHEKDALPKEIGTEIFKREVLAWKLGDTRVAIVSVFMQVGFPTKDKQTFLKVNAPWFFTYGTRTK